MPVLPSYLPLSLRPQHSARNSVAGPPTLYPFHTTPIIYLFFHFLCLPVAVAWKKREGIGIRKAFNSQPQASESWDFLW
ncbi:hypothetical protein V6N12_038842 [Hibiscus sabdariffa]|uniref:Uncharacterized protein n=1 Tax=Hibiscus sabdariffa TaxID=183260 RepID=A0ABR2DYV8_9ROSI